MKILFCVVFLGILRISSAQGCMTFRQDWKILKQCDPKFVVDVEDGKCKENTFGHYQIVMISLNKLYFTHWCRDSITPDVKALQCTILSHLSKLEIIRCNLANIKLEEYARQKSIEWLVIKEGNGERVFDMPMNIPRLKRISISSPILLPVRDVKFAPETLENLETLELHNFTLPATGRSPFKLLTHLKVLRLNYGSMNSVEPSHLTGLGNLRVLDLSGNNIRHISPTVAGMSKLEEIVLRSNKLTDLSSGLFGTVPNLLSLEVDNNPSLIKLPSNFFNNAGYLKIFNVANCSLRYVQKTTFRDERDRILYVKMLNLSYNRLLTIEEGSFNSLRYLEKLDISHNPIAILSTNNPFGSSNFLQEVVANNCNLTKMPNIDLNKHNLSKVDLSRNNIPYVTLPLYSKRKTEIWLHNNKIAIVAMDTTKRIYLINLDDISPRYKLVGNPIRCNFQTVSFINFFSSFQYKATTFPDLHSVNCIGTKNHTVTRVDPVSIKALFYCPLECFCTDRKIYCQKLHLSRIPFPLPRGAQTLHLENNRVSALNAPDPIYWDNIRKLFISHNSLRSLENWDVPSKLEFIAVDHNPLKNLSSSLMAHAGKNPNFRISLDDNDWKCDCDFVSTKTWLTENRHKIITSKPILCEMCTESGCSKNVSVADTPISLFCQTTSTSSVNIALIVALVLSLSIILVGIIFYKKFSVLWTSNVKSLPPFNLGKYFTRTIAPMDAE